MILLDDSIVLGTTLVDLYDDVVTRVGSAELVTTLVAAVDRERYNLAFADRLKLAVGEGSEVVARSTKELEGFAFDVASCLYRAGVPYFTDFPACAPLSTTTEALFDLLRTDRWLAADVSAPKMFAGPRDEPGRWCRAGTPPREFEPEAQRAQPQLPTS